MALENAKQFLVKTMKDAELSEKVRMKDPGDVAALAEKMGFDFTAEERISAAARPAYEAYMKRCPKDTGAVRTGGTEPLCL